MLLLRGDSDKCIAMVQRLTELVITLQKCQRYVSHRLLFTPILAVATINAAAHAFQYPLNCLFQ